MQLVDWIKKYRETLTHFVQPVDICKMIQWELNQGLFKRDDGAFFSIEGYNFSSNLAGHLNEEVLLINQPETGILGFLIAEENTQTFILCQAKSEPGNIYLTQIGPSVQATVSNYQRKHGGLPQPYLSLFTGSINFLNIKVKQSEQGYRFLNKYNLNIVIKTNINSIVIKTNKYKWYNIEEIASNINEDFLFNTDFKSVFASMLEKRILQKSEASKFDNLIMNSYLNYQFEENVNAIYNRLIRTRNQISRHSERIPLENMKNWQLKDNGFVPIGDFDYGVACFDVTLEDREIRNWQQPLIIKSSKDLSVLMYFKENGAFHFIFNSSYEPGFLNKIQLSPTISEKKENINLSDWGSVTQSFQQSEEGGRFFQNITEYVLLEAKNIEVFKAQKKFYILNVYSICQLLKIPGVFTNESRTLISSLHNWL